MKKLIVAIACVLPLAALAAPFVKSTNVFPTADVTHFQIVIDGGAPIQVTPFASGGGVILKHDIAGLAAGPHTAVGRACNVFGCGTDSPVLSFTSGTGSINWTGTLVIESN